MILFQTYGRVRKWLKWWIIGKGKKKGKEKKRRKKLDVKNFDTRNL